MTSYALMRFPKDEWRTAERAEDSTTFEDTTSTRPGKGNEAEELQQLVNQSSAARSHGSQGRSFKEEGWWVLPAASGRLKG